MKTEFVDGYIQFKNGSLLTFNLDGLFLALSEKKTKELFEAMSNYYKEEEKLKRQEITEEVVKRIKERFPKSDVWSKTSSNEDETWIVVNEDTYNSDDYQLFITELQMDYVYKHHIHSFYFVSDYWRK